jgi:TorA maturation chaperone TorD
VGDQRAKNDGGSSPIPEILESLRERAGTYGFFAVLCVRELDADKIKAIRKNRLLSEPEDFDPELADQFGDGNPEDLAEELACEFTRLFLGPKPILPPYQSCHEDAQRSGERTLWSQSSSEVYRYVKDLGLEFGEAYHGIPDHISLVLEMMQKFLDEEAAALDGTDAGRAEAIRKIRLTFFENHVGPWGQRFFSSVEKESMHPFYQAVGKLASRFLALETETCAGEKKEVSNKSS